MGKKSPPPKAPDLSPISDAQLQIARESNELAREFMGMSREQYAYMQENAKDELALARQQADRLFEFQNKAFDSDEEAKAFARTVGQSQIDSMNLQMDYAKRDRERYEKTFLPMQDQYIKEANEYDTAARREEAAGGAMADTQRQAEAARANADQRLRSMGLDPSQMRSASLLQTQDVMGAAQQAAAANQARLQVENQGRAMRADAMNLGMGLPSQAAAGFGGAGAAGQGAVGAGQAGQQAQLNAIQGGAGVGGQAMGFRSNALNNLSNLTGSPMQWAGMGGNMQSNALSGYGAAGNTMNQGYANQSNRWQQGQQQSQQVMSNIMGAAGMAAMIAEGGEVRRNYAEGGAVDNQYYAEGGASAGMQPSLGTPMGRPTQPMSGTSYGSPAPLSGTAARQNMQGQQPPPMQRGPQQAFGALMPPGQYQNFAEGGGLMKKLAGKLKKARDDGRPLTGQERLKKGLMLASMAPENSWAGGELGAGQYMDSMSSLGNKDYMNPTPAIPQSAAMPNQNTMAINAPPPQYNPQQPQFAAEGGQTRSPMRARGAIPTRQSRDEVPAYLAEGEYVLPADVVRALGIEKLDRMVAKYHRENA